MALKFGNVQFDSQINPNVGYMKLFSHPAHSCNWKERACPLQSNHRGMFANRRQLARMLSFETLSSCRQFIRDDMAPRN